MRTSHARATVEELEMECTHCKVRMTSSSGGGGTIRYYRCPGCSRWTSSVYSEVLRADTKMRRAREAAAEVVNVGPVKERLARWLASLTVGVPYRELGASPGCSNAELRARYLALARVHHPDRGGRADDMRRINDAYEKVLAHRESLEVRSAGHGLSLGSAP